jgi:hypothetical protein
MARPALYRGTRPNEPLRLNPFGLLWLTDNPEVARRYVRYGDRGLLWSVRLRDDAKILDLTDLSIPLTRKVYEALDQHYSTRFSVGVEEESWSKYAMFSLLEHHPWVRTMLMRSKRQGVVLYDTISTTNVPHISVALFTLKAIESAEAVPVDYDRHETIGDIEAQVERWQRAHPESMKPFRGRARPRSR